MRFPYIVEPVRYTQKGSQRRFAEVTSWGKLRLRQCDANYLNYPWGKNDSSNNFLFHINRMFNFYSYFSFSKIFQLKEQIQYPHLNAAKVSYDSV